MLLCFFFFVLVVFVFVCVLVPPCTSADACRQHLQRNSSFLPQTFDDLRHCVSALQCAVFQRSVNWDGHYSTRSEEWLEGQWFDDDDWVVETVEENTTAVTEHEAKTKHLHRHPRTIPCFHSLRYEPYVVIRWCPATATGTVPTEQPTSHNRPVAPYYDELFYGYGKNKIE